MNTLDTRDLIEEREETQQRILDDWNEKFEDEQLDDFSEIPTETEDSDVAMFLEYWEDELKQIEEVNELENDIDNGEFDFGTTLIDEHDFEEYCEELVSDIGDLPKDLPSYISNNIDWEGVAEDLKVDYSEVEFRGTSYLYR